MTDPRFVPDAEFAQIVRNAPLVSIDVVVKDARDHALVGLRCNEPAKGTYFVPGGVIRKNETIAAAFTRIVKAELGLEMTIDTARFLGVFQHFYDTNRFGDPAYGTHYVVLAHELTLGERPTITLDSQHNGLRWMSADEICRASDVHPNTQAYFR